MRTLGDTVGPYVLEKVLATGGMGVVHRAVAPDGARVAIKTLRPGTELSAEALRREVAGMSRVRHPGIVRLLDSGVDAGGPWIAMELVVGRSLASVLAPSGSQAAATWSGDDPEAPIGAAHGLPLDQALGFARALCAPLAALHAEGVVHRDVKPENAIVRPDGAVVLVDFGLFGGFVDDRFRESLDALALVGGTPAYMAPEQVLGEPVDARCDLYALGCLTFELLTGRPPFVGSREHVFRQHVSARPPRVSELRAVPAPIDDLVDALLAKSPGDRPGYADDVAAALGASPEPTRPWLYRPRLAGRADEVRAAVAAVLAGGVVVVAGDAGIGKTRLAFEVVRTVRATGRRVLVGRCPESRVVALGGLRPVLRALGPAMSPRHAAGLLPFEPELASRVAAGTWSPPLSRSRLHAVLREALAAAAPLLIVLDDWHDADELLAGFVDAVAAEPIPGVSLLATFRTEEGRAAPAGPAAVIPLARIAAEAVGSLVGDMLAQRAPPRSLVTEVAERSGGNPFFAAELLRAAAGAGLLWRADGAWRVGAVTGRLPLPDTLAEIVAERLSWLSPGARRVADACAILGRDVDPALLPAVSGVDDVAGALAECEARQILQPAPEGRVRFLHDRLLEVAAAGIADPAALHRRAADALRGLGRVESARVATHLAAAGARAEARPFVLAAAREAVARMSLAEAERWYVDWLTDAPVDVERITVQNELANSVFGYRCEYGRSLALLDETRAAALAIGDAEGAFTASIAVVALYREAGRVADAARAGAEARARAATPYQHMRAEIEIALDAKDGGRNDDAEVALRRALALAEQIGDRKGVAVSLLNLAGIEDRRGHSREALALLRQGRELIREIEPFLHLANGVNELLFAIAAGEDRVALRALSDRLIASYREQGMRLHLATTLVSRANLDERDGDFAAAEGWVREALDEARAAGANRLVAMYREDLARVILERGRPAEALAIAHEAATSCAALGAWTGVVHARVRAADALIRLGRWPEAEAELALAEAADRQVGDPRAQVEIACLRGQIAQSRGESPEAWLEDARDRAASFADAPGAAHLRAIDRLSATPAPARARRP